MKKHVRQGKNSNSGNDNIKPWACSLNLYPGRPGNHTRKLTGLIAGRRKIPAKKPGDMLKLRSGASTGLPKIF